MYIFYIHILYTYIEIMPRSLSRTPFPFYNLFYSSLEPYTHTHTHTHTHTSMERAKVVWGKNAFSNFLHTHTHKHKTLNETKKKKFSIFRNFFFTLLFFLHFDKLLSNKFLKTCSKKNMDIQTDKLLSKGCQKSSFAPQNRHILFPC